jgi:hypothetical protein
MNAWIVAVLRAARSVAERLRALRARRGDAERETYVRSARDVHDVERRERSWERSTADGWVAGWCR